MSSLETINIQCRICYNKDHDLSSTSGPALHRICSMCWLKHHYTLCHSIHCFNVANARKSLYCHQCMLNIQQYQQMQTIPLVPINTNQNINVL